MATQDFYQVLGITEKATPEEIKKSYRRLAKQFHPDANPNNPAASEKFKQLSEAHTVLADPEKRAKYDQMRRLGAFDPMTRRGGGRTRAGTPPGSGPAEGFDFGDFGSMGLGDIFSSIFGRGRKESGGTAGGAAEPIEVSVTVPFRTAVLGDKVPIQLPLSEACGRCGGTGGEPGATLSSCPECEGRGTISFGQGGFAVNRPCPLCRGRGRVPSAKCSQCGGAGEVRTERKVMITVPPGTDAGMRVRLKGMGQPGRPGGKAGDLLVTFEVEPDRFFRRAGLDLVCDVPINVAQAMLGTRIKVKTIEGTRAVLRIPAGTQSGRKFRIKGQGVPKGGRRGDQLVQIEVRIPEELSPEAEERLKEFATEAGLRF